VIRPAEPRDVPTLVALVHALAAYEREAESCTVTEDQLRTALFDEQPAASSHVAVEGDDVVGFALWFPTYSTWTGERGLWLEDLFVLPEHRGAGHGKALFSALARHCVQRGWPRFEWEVLDWNQPSIDFYEAHGARHLKGWLPYRLDGPALLSSAAAG
jgi:GNAT superfamily N-acetyltransferase